MSRYSAKIFLSCIRFQYAYCIFISRQNKLICVQRASKKDHKVCLTSSPPSGNTPASQLEYRCRAEDLAFFPPCSFSPQHLFIFVVRMVHTTGETREYYLGSTYYLCLIYRMSCDDPSLLRWIGRIQTIISFATFSIIYLIWRSSEDDFSLYMLHFLAYSGYVRKIR